MKIKELLTDESKWAKGAMAYDAKGTPCDSRGLEATKWCIIGAGRKCYGNERFDIFDKIKNYIKTMTSQESMIQYNDYIATWSDIQKLINDLDI